MELYDSVTPDEAARAFPDQLPPLKLCDGQFYSLPASILCFFTLGAPESAPHLATPSSVVWRPVSGRAGPADGAHWLPSQASETQRHASHGRRTHQIFVRAAGDAAYVYLGPAHLSSYGGDQARPTAVFDLRARCPRRLWLQFGGYPGWRVEVNHSTYDVAPHDDAAFERLLGHLADQEFSHLVMTRYEEDSLRVHTNARCAWLMYLREPDDSGLYLAPRAGGGDGVREDFRCCCGIELDFAASQTAQLDEARAILMHLFREGTLPGGRPWVEDEA